MTIINNPLVYNSTPTTRTDGTFGVGQSDPLGNALTSQATRTYGEDPTNDLLGVQAKPVVDTKYSWTRMSVLVGAAGANGAVLKASAGQVFSVYCRNTTGAARYFQLFNQTTVPADGVAPTYSFLVPASGYIVLDGAFFGADGQNFATGIYWCVSSTEATKTIGATTDCTTAIHYV